MSSPRSSVPHKDGRYLDLAAMAGCFDHHQRSNSTSDAMAYAAHQRESVARSPAASAANRSGAQRDAPSVSCVDRR